MFAHKRQNIFFVVCDVNRCLSALYCMIVSGCELLHNHCRAAEFKFGKSIFSHSILNNIILVYDSFILFFHNKVETVIFTLSWQLTNQKLFSLYELLRCEHQEGRLVLANNLFDE